MDAGSSFSTATGEATGPAPHLAIATLRAYRAGSLDPSEDTRIREHLEACADCRELASDVGAFFDADQPGEEETRVDKGGSWSRLEADLAREGWFEARRRGLRLVVALPVAAALAGILVLGAARLVLGYGREATVLVADGAYKGSQDGTVSVRLPVLLRLVPSAPGGGATYRVDLLDDTGSLLRSYEGVRADRGGRVPLRLRRWQLEPGRYRLLVRTSSQRPADPADEFSFGVQGLRK